MTSSPITLLIVFAIWIALVLGCSAPPSKQQTISQPAATNNSSPTPVEVISVTAPQLVADYKANEVAADEKYKNRLLAVTGKIDRIGKDIMDDMYVTLESGERYGIISVQSFFDVSHKDRLTQLRKGQQVTITGTCDGKFGNVLIKDAELR
jgi:hypothetical protein